MTYEFEYSSDIVADMMNADLCQDVFVTIAADLTKSRTDTPLGPTPWGYSVDSWKLIRIVHDDGTDLTPKVTKELMDEIEKEIEAREQDIIDEYAAK